MLKALLKSYFHCSHLVLFEIETSDTDCFSPLSLSGREGERIRRSWERRQGCHRETLLLSPGYPRSAALLSFSIAFLHVVGNIATSSAGLTGSWFSDSPGERTPYRCGQAAQERSRFGLTQPVLAHPCFRRVLSISGFTFLAFPS